MTDYTCPNCNLQFSLSLAADDLRCPKCGQGGLAERLPDVLEEAEGAAAAPEPRAAAGSPAPIARKAPVVARRSGKPGASAARRAGAGAGAEAAPAKRKPIVAIAAVVVVVAVAAAYFATRGGGGADPTEPGARDVAATDATATGREPGAEPGADATAPIPQTGDPRADFQARRARLAVDDLAGRKELLEFCREHGLDDARGPLLREILLLDSEDEIARRSFGFTRHDNPGSPLHGRWLNKADAELAAAFDSLLAK